MDEIIGLSLRMRKQCEEYAESLASQFAVSQNTPPISAFNMAHNEATITAELLNYYKSIWVKSRKANLEEICQMREENGQRVMAATNRTFISSLSAIEYVAKLALQSKPDLLPVDWDKRVYLSLIVGKSKTAGWIDNEMKKNLDDLIFVRNCLVHNNGVSDEDRDLFRPYCERLEAKEGQMIQCDLKLPLEYTCYACEAFKTWSESFLRAIQCSGDVLLRRDAEPNGRQLGPA